MNKKRGFLRPLAGLAALTLLISACNADSQTASAPAPAPDPAPAVDEAPAPFYKSTDVIEIIVPASPGGGADTTARVIAPFITEFVEGNPSVQIVNLPGGGTVTGSNEFALNRPADGKHLLLATASSLGAWAIGVESVQFDVSDMRFVAGFPSGLIYFARADTGIVEPKDLFATESELFLANTSATGIGTLSVLALEVLELGDLVTVISGYEGAGAARIAFEVGEVNLANQTGQAFNALSDQVESGEIVPLFTLGLPDGKGSVVRDPAYPNLPTIADFHEQLYGKAPSGEAWDAFIEMLAIIPWLPIAIQKDAPQAAYDALVAGLEEARFSARFNELRMASAGDYQMFVGKDWAPVDATLQNVSPEIRRWTQDWLIENYGVTGLKR